MNDTDQIRLAALNTLGRLTLSDQHINILNTVFFKGAKRQLQNAILQTLEMSRGQNRALLQNIVVETRYDTDLKLTVLQGFIRQLSGLTTREIELLITNVSDSAKDPGFRRSLIGQLESVNASSLPEAVAKRISNDLIAIAANRAESKEVRLAAINAAGVFLGAGRAETLATKLLAVVADAREETELRIEAAKVLSEVKGVYDLKPLMVIVHDVTERAALRAVALNGIAASSSAQPQVQDLLLNFARRDPHLEVREAAVRILTRFAKEAEIFEFLKELLLKPDADEMMRALAVAGLALADKNKAGELIDKIRDNEKNPLVQWAIRVYGRGS